MVLSRLSVIRSFSNWWDERKALCSKDVNRPIQGYRRHFVRVQNHWGERGQTNGKAFDAFTMPKHARCCVGFCDSNKRFPHLLVVRFHVKELKFHRWPKDPNLAELWRKQVAKGRSDNFNPEPGWRAHLP